MNKELIEFKSARISALNKQFNIDVASFNRIHSNNVYTVNRNRRLSSRQKQLTLGQLAALKYFTY